MILAAFLSGGKDDLICDFAEYYQIYDIRQVKPSIAAVLAIGLRDDSRTKMRLAGAKIDQKTMLLAAIADRLSILVWQKTRDGQRNQNKPKSIVDELTRDHSADVVGFTTSEDFEKERQRLIHGD